MKRQFLAVATAVGALVCLMAWPAVAQSVKATPAAMHNDNAFARIAPKVHTSSFNLEREFENARRDNAKLTRPQFLTAKLLSENVSGDHPDASTTAILRDLKAGRSFQRSLEGLGLDRSQAATAVREAEREVRAAEQTTPAADKPMHGMAPAHGMMMKKDSTKTHGG
jgi:hypothetical protein